MAFLRPLRGAALSFLVVCAASAVSAEGGDLGRRLFQGDGGEASVQIEGRRLRACWSCHGRDGRGGLEGGAPAVAASLEGEGLFDIEGLRRALTLGATAEGAPLSILMPRYDLPEEALGALAAYLADLPGIQRQGVHPREIRFVVPYSSGGEARAQDYAARLEASLKLQLGASGAFGRQPSVRPILVASETCSGPLSAATAVVGLPPELDGLRPCLAEGGPPALYPLYPLADRRREGDAVCSLFPSWGEISRDVVAALSALGATGAILPETGHPLLEPLADELAVHPDLRRVHPDKEAFDPQKTMILNPEESGFDLPLLRPVLTPERLLRGEEVDAATRRDGLLLIYGSGLVSAAAESGDPLPHVHADLAAGRLAAALLAAGRGVTRAELLRRLLCLPPASEAQASLIPLRIFSESLGRNGDSPP